MERKELKLFNQLYEISKPLENDDLETLNKKAKIYDINPNLNYEIMIKMLEQKKLTYKDQQIFYNFFCSHIQTLFYNQKIDIIEYIKNNKDINILITKNFKLYKKSFVDSFFDILEILYDASFNSGKKPIEYNKILNLFWKDYYVDNTEINIPLIYGTNELIFAGLINDLYFELFTEKKKEKMIKSKKDIITEFDEYPKSKMIKIDNNINNNNKAQIENNNNQIMETDIEQDIN